MALRAFRLNPSLGGFGGESAVLAPRPTTTTAGAAKTHHKAKGSATGRTSDIVQLSDVQHSTCDAFAQIVKELVDNAVDACSTGATLTLDSTPSEHQGERSASKRVRVVIQPEKMTATENISEDELGIEDANETHNDNEVLRVSVSDNGCGMENIQNCVEAFQTNKAGHTTHNEKSSQRVDNSNEGIDSQEKENDEPNLTAGRYGIGLTLCLLHAQRLVPDSCASITSATASSIQWTRASYVVDTEGDTVRCVKKEHLPKKRRDESGTAISLLVPGGMTAQRAWPRLAEYFARFQLSLGLNCSVQVMAPTLSSVPLFIRPPIEMARRERKRNNNSSIKDAHTETQNEDAITKDDHHSSEDDHEWNDGLTDDDDDEQSSPNQAKDYPVNTIPSVHERISSSEAAGSDNVRNKRKDYGPNVDLTLDRRRAILQAVSSYLSQPLDLRNVAHSIQRIRSQTNPRSQGVSEISGRQGRNGYQSPTSDEPHLEVDMIVYTANNEESHDNDEEYMDDEVENMFGTRPDSFSSERHDREHSREESSKTSARLMLIRMVNRVPLLDGAEASACGLVRGIMGKRSTWNSFGLDVSMSSAADLNDFFGGKRAKSKETAPLNADGCFIPTYEVSDSVQVAPFFQSSTHSLFEPEDEEEKLFDQEEEEQLSDNDSILGEAKKRKRKSRKLLLPAHLRLGNILIIAQIHATPSALPLPTLSKGRLPLNDKAIDDALEVGLVACLRSLQKSNPDLLLTAHQLKKAERETRYIPAVAAALSSIVCASKQKEIQNEEDDYSAIGFEEVLQSDQSTVESGKEIKECSEQEVGHYEESDCLSNTEGSNEYSSRGCLPISTSFPHKRAHDEHCTNEKQGPVTFSGPDDDDDNDSWW
eukprot:scaffold32099_cov50-Attheya_sp.AAC.10